MRNKFCPIFFFVIIVAAAPGIRAQSSATTAPDLWNAVPESDFVASCNVRKIFDEALPRVLGGDASARKDLEGGLAETRAQTGLDVRRISRAVVGAQFAGTGLDVNLQEVVVVAEGEFNSQDIKDVMKGAHRDEHEEKYNGYTLLVFREYDDPNLKKNELAAVVMLEPNLMAAGYLSAVKRAIDAFHDGKGRARADLIERAESAPDALVSMAARIPNSYLKPKGTDTLTNRLNRMLSSIKDVEATIRQGENGFPFVLAVRSDSVDSAADLKCMVESARTLADFALTDMATVKVLDDLKISLDGNATLVQTEISVEQIRAIVNPPKPTQATKPAGP